MSSKIIFRNNILKILSLSCDFEIMVLYRTVLYLQGTHNETHRKSQSWTRHLKGRSLDDILVIASHFSYVDVKYHAYQCVMPLHLWTWWRCTNVLWLFNITAVIIVIVCKQDCFKICRLIIRHNLCEWCFCVERWSQVSYLYGRCGARYRCLRFAVRSAMLYTDSDLVLLWIIQTLSAHYGRPA